MPKRRWSDDVKEWTGLSIPECITLATDRTAWRSFLSSVFRNKEETTTTTLPQTDNHTSTPPLSFFTSQMPFLPPNQQCQGTQQQQEEVQEEKEHCGVSIKPLLLCDMAENLAEMVT